MSDKLSDKISDKEDSIEIIMLKQKKEGFYTWEKGKGLKKESTKYTGKESSK